MDKFTVDERTVRFISRLAKVVSPTEEKSLSDWANDNMVLPDGDSQAGRYSTKNAPYQKDVMDAITDPAVMDVTMMFSAQVGKSLIMKCGIGYYIDHEPSTQIIVLPTSELGERFSKTSLAPMINDVEAVRNKVAKDKTRDSNNTIKSKNYPGGDLVIAGANSPSSLSQLPRRIVWMDEVDRFPGTVGEEGNPVMLAEKRSTSYWNRKHIKTSTPTIKGKSKIEDAYQEGSMEEWCVACPECGEYQPYDFKRVDFDTISMTCKYCGCLIPELRWKKSAHKWIAKYPERIKKRSFHMNELASPFVDWENTIETFKKAMVRLEKYHDVNDLKTFINTSLGETWDETELDSNKVSKETLGDRAEYYAADIPDGAIVLTASIDVQADRFEVEVRGWGRDYETWGIKKIEIYGQLMLEEPWNELEKFLEKTYCFENGTELSVAAFAIDSGGNHTNDVYKWSKKMKKKGLRCYAIKGYAQKPDIPLYYKKTAVNITERRNGKEIIVDHTVVHILGVDSGKEDIMNRLTIQEPGAGYCHFPSNEGRGYDDKYYEGLLSEHKVGREVRGVYKDVWVKEAGVRNEPLDLFNYNYAAFEILRPDLDVLEKKIKSGINYMKSIKKRTAVRKTVSGGVEV